VEGPENKREIPDQGIEVLHTLLDIFQYKKFTDLID